MLWESWRTRKATSDRPTSHLFRRELQAEFGDEWKIWASDLDQAIYEFGTWVESQVDKRIHEYTDSIRRRNSAAVQRNKGSKSQPMMEKVSRSRIREIAEEATLYYVYDTVREYTSVLEGSGGRVTGMARVYLEKDATGDREVDENMGIGDVRVVRVEEVA